MPTRAPVVRAVVAAVLSVVWFASADDAFELPEENGYRGIWYANQPSGDEYAFKYSGGMATYPQQHAPIAIHVPAVKKTFFVYGGTTREGKPSLLHMVSYFDHETGMVPRPRILLDKRTTDAHDNPTLLIDPDGYLWIFSNSHGTSRPSFIHRSEEPYDIRTFRPIIKTNFSYSQPWLMENGLFLVLHTRYAGGRRVLHEMRSENGSDWSTPRVIASAEQGHYQVSTCQGNRVATAFNVHPPKGGLNARTNLYYLETTDGEHWRTAAGNEVTLPVSEKKHPSLVRDYQSEELLVYLKDVNFDRHGHPVILYLTSRHYASGPMGDPRTWRVAHWNGAEWTFQEITTSDHNYDFGSLYTEEDGTWRIIAPTDSGAESYATGGQIVMWTSDDEGANWTKSKVLTKDDVTSHTYVRRPRNAHPDFYALWANGLARKKSDSSLFFTNRSGEHVWQLPEKMTSTAEKPVVRW